MATTKITDLTAYTDPVSTDVVPIVDVTSDVTKKVSIADLMENAGSGTEALPGISFDGDPNTGIYRPGADQVAISTNGQGRLFVDAGGNVGVGSTSPSSYSSGFNQLVVGSTGDQGVTIVSGTSNSGTLAFADGTSGADAYRGYVQYQHGTTNALVLAANGSERLRITSTGEFEFTGAGTAGTTQAVYFSGSAPVNSLVVDSNGRVGIGTSTPNELLEVSGTENQGIRLTSTAGSGEGANLQWYSMQTGDNKITAEIESDGSGTGGNLFFKTRSTAGVLTDRMLIDNAGNVGIGTTSPQGILETASSSASNVYLTSTGGNSNLRIVAQDGGLSSIIFGDTSDAFTSGITFDHSDNSLQLLGHNYAERARIDSSGRLLVGTSTSPSASQGANSNLVVQGYVGQPTSGGIMSLQRGEASASIAGDQLLGRISFNGSDGYSFADITARSDEAAGAGDYPGALLFSTTADGASSPTERMRIRNNGYVYMGDGSSSSLITYPYGSNGGHLIEWNRAASALTTTAAAFRNGGTGVGSITYTNSATAYNTSSDYRLKENVTPVTDGITRLQQLKPSRFNFIADPDKTVDGFLAHEAQTVVPEAVTGTHNEVDDEGNPVYQGIDQSKLVPLLTAALQEAIAKIETLEAKVAALEAN